MVRILVNTMHFANRRITFRSRAWPTLAAFLLIGLTLHLATWQQGRAAEKRGLQAEFDQRVASVPAILDAKAQDADALRYRRAVARGEWFADGQIYLDNKTDGGTAGYHVVTPLKLSGTSTFVLVNRGWIARGPNYPAPPLVEGPAGPVEVLGTVTVPTSKFLELSAEGIQTNVWQNLTIDRYRKRTRLDVLPFVLLAGEVKPDAKHELLMLTEHPDAGVEKHIEYMLTWYSLSVTIAILWIALNLNIMPPEKPNSFHAGNAP